MKNNKLDVLERTDSSSKPVIQKELSKIYKNSKRSINWICKTLTFPIDDYTPDKTVEQIQAYLEKQDKISRILYSEISNFLFNLSEEKRATFLGNLEKLLIYSMDKNITISSDALNVIVKIYDHSQLVNYQIENINSTFNNSISNAKIDLHKEIKGIEKEYISILGIFASIILAFVGGITFSSSVLQNIGTVSIYRLLLVTTILGFVLVNVIWLLLKFISMINDKDIKIFKIETFDKICLIFIGVLLLAWIFNINAIPSFLSKISPWCK